MLLQRGKPRACWTSARVCPVAGLPKRSPSLEPVVFAVPENQHVSLGRAMSSVPAVGEEDLRSETPRARLIREGCESTLLSRLGRTCLTRLSRAHHSTAPPAEITNSLLGTVILVVGGAGSITSDHSEPGWESVDGLIGLSGISGQVSTLVIWPGGEFHSLSGLHVSATSQRK